MKKQTNTKIKSFRNKFRKDAGNIWRKRKTTNKILHVSSKQTTSTNKLHISESMQFINVQVYEKKNLWLQKKFPLLICYMHFINIYQLASTKQGSHVLLTCRLKVTEM